MPTPRKNQVCLDSTPYYHCISRCVRRAFLCGYDEFSGQSYAQNKTPINQLLSVFILFAHAGRWFPHAKAWSTSGLTGYLPIAR